MEKKSGKIFEGAKEAEKEEGISLKVEKDREPLSETEDKTETRKMKAEAIKDYFRSVLEEAPYFDFKDEEISEEIKEVENLEEFKESIKEFLPNQSPKELERTFTPKGFELAYQTIIARQELIKELKEIDVFRDKRVAKYLKKEKFETLPLRIQYGIRTLSNLDESRLVLNRFLRFNIEAAMRGIEENKHLELADEGINELKYDLLPLLRRRIKTWKKIYSFKPKREKIKLKGFEKLNTYGINGEELLEKAAQLLPEKELFSKRVGMINFRLLRGDKGEEGEKCKLQIRGRQYGKLGIKDRITIYKGEEVKIKKFLKKFVDYLIHEYIHSLDPRRTDLPELSALEQLEFLEGWEKIRLDELKTISPFVTKSIRREEREIWSKTGQEAWLEAGPQDLAESGVLLLTRLNYFKKEFPKRYESLVSFLKKYFPDFDPEKIAEEKLKYDAYIAELKKKIK